MSLRLDIFTNYLFIFLLLSLLEPVRWPDWVTGRLESQTETSADHLSSPGHHLLGQEEHRISHNTGMMKKQMENTGLRFPCFV